MPRGYHGSDAVPELTFVLRGIEMATRFRDQAGIVNLPQLVAADPNVISCSRAVFVPVNVQWNAVRSPRGSSLSKVTIMSGKSRMNACAQSPSRQSAVRRSPSIEAFAAKNAATLSGF